MKNINFPAIAEVLGAMKCSVHHRTGEIDFGPNSLGYKNLCCEEFEDELDKEFTRQIEKHLFGDDPGSL